MSRPRTSKSTHDAGRGTASSAKRSPAPAPRNTGWWRYRVPGRGQLDWNRIIDTLDTSGFDGAVAVEHEDPVWGGTHTKIKQGLEIAAQTLRPLIRCRSRLVGAGRISAAETARQRIKAAPVQHVAHAGQVPARVLAVHQVVKA
jgi:hypothetical protein